MLIQNKIENRKKKYLEIKFPCTYLNMIFFWFKRKKCLIIVGQILDIPATVCPQNYAWVMPKFNLCRHLITTAVAQCDICVPRYWSFKFMSVDVYWARTHFTIIRNWYYKLEITKSKLGSTQSIHILVQYALRACCLLCQNS